MLRVETVFTSYRCPKLNRAVDVRIDRLRDAESNRVLSQKFKCDQAAECSLTVEDPGDALAGCPHPEAMRMAAQQFGAGG